MYFPGRKFTLTGFSETVKPCEGGKAQLLINTYGELKLLKYISFIWTAIMNKVLMINDEDFEVKDIILLTVEFLDQCESSKSVHNGWSRWRWL